MPGSLARGSCCFEDGLEDFNPGVKFARMVVHWLLGWRGGEVGCGDG